MIHVDGLSYYVMGCSKMIINMFVIKFCFIPKKKKYIQRPLVLTIIMYYPITPFYYLLLARIFHYLTFMNNLNSKIWLYVKKITKRLVNFIFICILYIDIIGFELMAFVP